MKKLFLLLPICLMTVLSVSLTANEFILPIDQQHLLNKSFTLRNSHKEILNSADHTLIPPGNNFHHTLKIKEGLQLSVTPGTSICPGDSIELSVKVAHAIGKVSYRWSHGLMEGTTHKVFPKETTLYTVEAKDEKGNTATATIKITLHSPPQPTISGVQKICPGVIAQLDAGEFYAYEWSTGAKTRIIQVSDDGEVKVRVQDHNGCWGETEIQIEEREFKYPKITGELGFCPGLTAQLNAGEFTAYRWNTGDTTRTIEVGDDGIYSVTVQDEFGCESIAREEVIEYEPAIPEIRGDLSICPGSTTRLNARGHFDFYAWSTGETTPVIEVNKAGIYRINVESEDGCLGEKTFEITERVPPKPVITGLSTICSGDTSILDAGLFTQYTWNTGDTTQTITVSKPGTYTVTVTDEQDCHGTTSKKIELNIAKIKPLAAGPDQEIKQGEAAKLSASKAIKYQWEPASSLSCSNCQKPVATPTQTTTYYLTAWDKNGCSLQDSVTVTVLQK